MKKIIIIIFMFSFCLTIKAESTLDLIVSEMKQDYYVKTYNTEILSTSIENNLDSFTIVFENKRDLYRCETKFTYLETNSIFTFDKSSCYLLSGESNEFLTEKSDYFKQLWINELIKTIGNLKGYSDNQISNWANGIDTNNLTLENDGIIETKENDYQKGNNIKTISISLDIFNIKENFLNISNKIDKKVNAINNNSTIIGIVLVLVVTIIYLKFKKK